MTITRTLLALAMTAAAATTTDPARAQTPAPASAAGLGAGTFQWANYAGEGGTRRYKLYLPAGYDASRPAPLVVMLHGCTQDPDDFARGTRFNLLADSAGVIVAYPEQTARHNPQKCWSWYDPASQRRGTGETAIVAGIAREVSDKYAVDAGRVYVAGVSAGGAMAVNAAVAYPELFAAAGAHSALPYGAARDVPSAVAAMRDGAEPVALSPDGGCAAPVPLIVFHGAADAVVNPENGRRLADQWRRAVGAKDFLRSDASAGGLRATRDRSGPFVELWMVEGLGHAWSGGSAEGTFTSAAGPDASREMLRFFLEHTS